MNFNITITEYTHGTYKIWSYFLSNDSIIVTKFSTNDLPPEIVVKRLLTEKEKNSFNDFIKRFPLASLKKEYSDDKVEGESHFIFDITISNQNKQIYVYFSAQKNLQDLSGKINQLIPEPYRIWYETYNK
ncbi:MAG: hypothetical protein HY958_07980 [Bacteroidia bacterium]|nr:hypothetical protein [Bacteroidia bacterium]